MDILHVGMPQNPLQKWHAKGFAWVNCGRMAAEESLEGHRREAVRTAKANRRPIRLFRLVLCGLPRRCMFAGLLPTRKRVSSSWETPSITRCWRLATCRWARMAANCLAETRCGTDSRAAPTPILAPRSICDSTIAGHGRVGCRIAIEACRIGVGKAALDLAPERRPFAHHYGNRKTTFRNDA